jgi:hypothetical protein
MSLAQSLNVDSGCAGLQAQFDAAVERMSGPAGGALLAQRPGAPPVVDAGENMEAWLLLVFIA